MNDQVPAIRAERIPYHPAIAERYGIDRSSWRALVDAVFPTAQSIEGVILALSYCRSRKLDVFKRPVHIVPIWNKEQGRYVETVWPGIGELRTTAFRTGDYVGSDPAIFGPDVAMTFKGMVGRQSNQREVSAKVTFPEWCQITVHRVVRGESRLWPGPRVYWLETYARQGQSEVPNEMWQRRARGQLEKCAEAAALRKAFPEEIGEDHISDEMGDPMVDITPADQQPQRRQPSAPTAYLDAFDALGSEYQLQAGEVAGWIANRCVDGQGGIAAATGDELDALLENNDEPAIKDAIEKAIAHLPRGPGPSGGGGNRNTQPQAVRTPPGDDRSAAPDDTGASGRGAQQGADAEQSASSGPSAGKRPRRSYHDIKADVLAALASAADLAEVERVMKEDITSGVRANTDLMAEITAAEKTARDRIKAAATPAAPAEPVATVLGKPAATWPDAERMINEQLEAAESANAITDADYDALGVDIKALQPHMPKAAAAFLERLDALPAEDHGDEPAEDASGDSDVDDNGRVVEPQDTQKADEPAEVYGLRDAKGQPYGEPVTASAFVRGLRELATSATDKADRGSIRAYNNQALNLIETRSAGNEKIEALIVQARAALAQ